MKKNRLIGLVLTALLAVSAVDVVPVSAADEYLDTDQIVIASEVEVPDKLKDADVAEMPLSEFISRHPSVLSEGIYGIGLEDFLAQGNIPIIVQPLPDAYNEVEFKAGFKEGVTMATESLSEYLKQQKEVQEDSLNVEVEDFLAQGDRPSSIVPLRPGNLEEALREAVDGTWVQLANGDWKYQLPDGSYASGWLQDTTGTWYYLDPVLNDVMVTGWWMIGGYWYYFNPSGSMKHGWLSSVDDDGNTIYYYMGRPGEPDTGAMYTGGWLHDTDGAWYYLYTDADASEHGSWGWEPGVMHMGWLDLDGYLYYMYPSAGHMATGNVQMSEYVLSRFETTGVHLGDTMTVKDTVTNPNTGVVYQPLNVRWDNLIVEDGHRIASATINGSLIDNALSSSPVTSAVNYFSSAASQWFTLASTSQSTANIILEWCPLDDYYYWNPNIGASTFCMNSSGEWTNGQMSPQNQEVDAYYTGTIIQSYIYVNSKIQTGAAAFDGIDLNYLIRHEICHAMGLRHIFESDYGETDPGYEALMYPFYTSDLAVPTFRDYDILELRKTYP